MSEKHAAVNRTQQLLHALVAVVGLLLISEPAWLPVKHFFAAVGEACIIAVLVIYLVEVYSHKRLEETAAGLISKVGKNIFGLVYGHELPPHLVDALEATLSSPVYRDRMHLDVELAKVSLKRKDAGEKDLCRLINSYRFELVNCSDSSQDRPFALSLERDKNLAEIIDAKLADPKFQYVKVGNSFYCDPLCKDELIRRLSLPTTIQYLPIEKHLEVRENGNELSFTLEKIAIPGNGRIEVMFSGVLYKQDSDNEVWRTAYSTLGVSLSASSTDFEVEARFPADGVAGTNLGALTSRWTYDAPLLGGQFVIYWWRPRKPVLLLQAAPV